VHNSPQPIDELLSFRRALTSGIKLGKSRVDSANQEMIPNTVLIDANTRLYKEPTRERLKPDNGMLNSDRPGFDTDDWRDALSKWLEAETPYDDSSSVSQSKAEEMMINEIYGNIAVQLGDRRLYTDKPVVSNRFPNL
jgi:hypothetical protein